MQYINRVENQLRLENFKNLQPIKFISYKTNINHRHITLVLLIIALSILIFFKQGQNLLLLILSFIYPFYRSFRDLKKRDKKLNQKWLIYWMFFGMLFGFNFLSQFFMNFIPYGKVILSFIFYSIYSDFLKGYFYLKKYILDNTIGRIPSKYDNYIRLNIPKKQNKNKKEPRIKSAISLRIPKLDQN